MFKAWKIWPGLIFSHFINHLTLDLVFEDSAVVVVNVAADVEVSAVVVVDLAVVVADQIWPEGDTRFLGR